jgi:hypothetical protein
MTNIPQIGKRWGSGFALPSWADEGLGDASSSTRAGGQALLQVAPFTGPAAPFVAAAGSVANFISSFLQPNIPKEVASERVDEIEADFMKPNVARWNALPMNHKTPEAQAAALDVFNKGWGGIIQFCSNMQLGSAGVNCIKDRQRGGRWDWWSYYYDPIANDPAVAANVAAAQAEEAAMAAAAYSGGGSSTGGLSNLINTAGIDSQTFYLVGGLALFGIAVAFALSGDD